MSRWAARSLIFGLLVVVVAACGGGAATSGATSSSATRSAASVATTAAAAATAPATMSAATNASPVTSPVAAGPATPSAMPLNTVIEVPDEGRTHVAAGSAISYQHYPPASGTHYPSPANWGVAAQALPEGSWVHNLEHGGVVLLFKCDPSTCSALAQQVLALAKSLPPSLKWQEIKFLGTPYSTMQSPFTLVAWDHEEALDSLDVNAVRSFYQTFVDHGPEDVP